MPTETAVAIRRALTARTSLIDPDHRSAFRLFNGFLEGDPTLAVDVYASTCVFHDYSHPPRPDRPEVAEAIALVREALPWIQTIVLKARNSPDADARRGATVFGSSPDTRVVEHGVAYAVDPMLNRDAGLYLDTRELRRWALAHLRGRTVLNTFAYTGSLGIAAAVGGASHVVQLDLNRRFMAFAERSAALNGVDPSAMTLLAGDFFPSVARLKRAGRTFDCVFLDPPFFASSARGVVDLEGGSTRLINKVRPLVADGGRLVVVNNALFVAGRDFHAELEALCRDGYLAIEALVPVPSDFAGYEDTRVGTSVTDPAPFNHSTKIAILNVRRKASS
jgi:23S rRNA (cytosine1962-C5)-methyltransferase